MTTLLAFATGLAALEIEGVQYDYGMDQPGSLTGAVLPAKWLVVPSADRERMALDVTGETAHGFGRQLRLTMIIALNPIQQGVPEYNFRETVEMSDNVTLAVTKADVAMSWPSVRTEARQISLAGGQEWYWALVAEITATG